MNLDEIRNTCVEIAEKKKFNNEPKWLERCMFKELGELFQAVEDRDVKKKDITEDDIGSEFIDYIVFASQYIALYIPKVNLNLIMHNEILKKETFGGDPISMSLVDIKDLCYNYCTENKERWDAIQLESMMFRSVADLIEVVEKKKNNDGVDDEQIAMVYCKSIYYGSLYLQLKLTWDNLDKLFNDKIAEILSTKKKTLEGDKIIEK